MILILRDMIYWLWHSFLIITEISRLQHLIIILILKIKSCIIKSSSVYFSKIKKWRNLEKSFWTTENVLYNMEKDFALVSETSGQTVNTETVKEEEACRTRVWGQWVSLNSFSLDASFTFDFLNFYLIDFTYVCMWRTLNHRRVWNALHKPNLDLTCDYESEM